MATHVVTPESLEALLAQSSSLAESTAVEVPAVEVKEPTLAELEIQAFEWIGRGREANIQLGHIFIRMKKKVARGEWLPYFKQKFVPKGVTLRTAQEYMKLADENAESACLEPDEAAEIEAELEVAPKKGKPRGKAGQKDDRYKLPLKLTSRESEALDELRESQNWHAAEMSLVASLRNLFFQYEIWKQPATQEEKEAEKAKFAKKKRVKMNVFDGESETAQVSLTPDCPPCPNATLCQESGGCVAEL
jgi:hypothetical protein